MFTTMRMRTKALFGLVGVGSIVALNNSPRMAFARNHLGLTTLVGQQDPRLVAIAVGMIHASNASPEAKAAVSDALKDKLTSDERDEVKIWTGNATPCDKIDEAWQLRRHANPGARTAHQELQDQIRTGGDGSIRDTARKAGVFTPAGGTHNGQTSVGHQGYDPSADTPDDHGPDTSLADTYTQVAVGDAYRQRGSNDPEGHQPPDVARQS